MADVDKSFIIPLRREWSKVQKFKRGKKAITAIKEYLYRHMKCDSVLIGNALNEFVWAHGIQNPHHKIEVHAIKDKDGTVFADLKGVEIVLSNDEKKGEKSGIVSKVKDAVMGKKDDKKNIVDAEIVKSDKISEQKVEVKSEKKKENATPKQSGKKSVDTSFKGEKLS